MKANVRKAEIFDILHRSDRLTAIHAADRDIGQRSRMERFVTEPVHSQDGIVAAYPVAAVEAEGGDQRK